MTNEWFEPETVPPVQDAVPEDGTSARGQYTPEDEEVVKTQNPGPRPEHAPNIYEDVKHGIIAAESDFEVMQRLMKENAALKTYVARITTPVNPESAPPGGPPVPHHLHLVDGRVIVNHGGIGTHYSETLPDGSQRITRVASYYPADEGDPMERYA